MVTTSKVQGILGSCASVLSHYAFAIVLDGNTGKKYVRCRECDGESVLGVLDSATVKHTDDCSINKLLTDARAQLKRTSSGRGKK